MLAEVEEHAARTANMVQQSGLVSQYQRGNDPDEVDLELIELLLQYICREGKFRSARLAEGQAGPPDGAVLVFLPGWDEISQLLRALDSPSFPKSRRDLTYRMRFLVSESTVSRMYLRLAEGSTVVAASTVTHRANLCTAATSHGAIEECPAPSAKPCADNY